MTCSLNGWLLKLYILRLYQAGRLNSAAILGLNRAAHRTRRLGLLCLGYTFEATPQLFLAQFAFRVCVGGASKMADSSANKNCSFNCKWQPSLWGLPFWKTLLANQSCSFNYKWCSPYVGCHFGGRTVFRVGRWIKFIHDVSRRYPERSPGHLHHDLVSVTSSWHWVNQSLTYPIAAKHQARKHKYQFYKSSMWLD